MSRPHSVLVVDDEPEILESLRRTLRGEPYRLVLTTSPHEALEHVQRGEIDLVVSDIDMPEMSGLDLIARVRALAPDVVRVLLTGDASLPSALSAINEGEVHRYLTKPWSKDELRTTLRRALERLDELRRVAEADRVCRERNEMLEDLEREYPGISVVERDRDVYLIDAEALAARLRAPAQVPGITAREPGFREAITEMMPRRDKR